MENTLKRIIHEMEYISEKKKKSQTLLIVLSWLYCFTLGPFLAISAQENDPTLNQEHELKTVEFHDDKTDYRYTFSNIRREEVFETNGELNFNQDTLFLDLHIQRPSDANQTVEKYYYYLTDDALNLYDQSGFYHPLMGCDQLKGKTELNMETNTFNCSLKFTLSQNQDFTNYGIYYVIIYSNVSKDLFRIKLSITDLGVQMIDTYEKK